MVLKAALDSMMATFHQDERQNIILYLVGLICYGLGLEIFNGSIITLALDRFNEQTFERLGILAAVNQGAQFLGAILIVLSFDSLCTVSDISGTACQVAFVKFIVIFFRFQSCGCRPSPLDYRSNNWGRHPRRKPAIWRLQS